MKQLIEGKKRAANEMFTSTLEIYPRVVVELTITKQKKLILRN